uniref:Uncharacterized protein n=1 Tax=Glossina austeni TaxID=7395 RepID=A0A1A9V414_GLOAU
MPVLILYLVTDAVLTLYLGTSENHRPSEQEVKQMVQMNVCKMDGMMDEMDDKIPLTSTNLEYIKNENEKLKETEQLKKENEVLKQKLLEYYYTQQILRRNEERNSKYQQGRLEVKEYFGCSMENMEKHGLNMKTRRPLN